MKRFPVDSVVSLRPPNGQSLGRLAAGKRGHRAFGTVSCSQLFPNWSNWTLPSPPKKRKLEIVSEVHWMGKWMEMGSGCIAMCLKQILENSTQAAHLEELVLKWKVGEGVRSDMRTSAYSNHVLPGWSWTLLGFGFRSESTALAPKSGKIAEAEGSPGDPRCSWAWHNVSPAWLVTPVNFQRFTTC